MAALGSHEHAWFKVEPPVVVVVNDPYAVEKGGVTYNARCATCSETAWLHWTGGRRHRARCE